MYNIGKYRLITMMLIWVIDISPNFHIGAFLIVATQDMKKKFTGSEYVCKICQI